MAATPSNKFMYLLAKKAIDLDADTIKVRLMYGGTQYFPFNKTTTPDRWQYKKNFEVNTGSVSFDVANSTNIFNRNDAGDFTADGFVIGNRITTSSAQAANQGPFLVSNVTASDLTVTAMDGSNPTLTDETAQTFIIYIKDTLDTSIDSAVGYTVTDISLTNSTVTQDDANNKVDITFDSAVWTATGGAIGPARGAILWDDTATDDPVIGFIDFGSDQTVADTETFTISGITISLIGT